MPDNVSHADVLVSLPKSHDCEELAVADPSALLLITTVSTPCEKTLFKAHFCPFDCVIVVNVGGAT